MSTGIREFALLCAMAAGSLVQVSLGADLAPVSSATGSCAPDGLQASGAVYRICMPALDRWNGELVVYAHGYVDPQRPIEIAEEQLEIPGGTSLPETANLLGFAFATSSYRTNGLAVPEGLEDLVDLVSIFAATHGEPTRVYLVGASEGGLITVLGAERYPDVFDGALATCGPVGDFRAQLNYFGDFRVEFDYFFPGVLPGSAVEIPEEVIENWESYYLPLILDSVRSDPAATQQLLNATRAAIDWRDPGSIESTVAELLWYNVHAANDAVIKLGGQPFDNISRCYKGLERLSGLGWEVERISADPLALEQIELLYQTSGNPAVPLVTLHTTRDPVVPYWQERQYLQKLSASGAESPVIGITVRRYGHCSFTAEELVEAFATLVREVRGGSRAGTEDILVPLRVGTGVEKPVRD